MRKAMTTAVICLLPLTAWAQPYVEERVFTQAGELYHWCREEAEAWYVGRGITPYQWRGTYHDYANLLQVRGRLRADGKDVEVQCRVARNARERHAAIQIDDPAF